MNNEEHFNKKIAGKSRVRKQQKKKVSQSSGTLSQQVKRGEIAVKRKKKSVKVKIS